ncbi:MAG: prephenate dehydrogenase [Brevinema sp.]
MFSTIYVVGLGLIGGSIVKQLSIFPTIRVLGEDNNPSTQRVSGISSQGLEEADLIFLCLPPSMVGSYINKNAHRFKKGAVLANCAGVQAHFFDDWDMLFDRGIELFGVHPMVGSEKAGFEHSYGDLFYQGSAILCVSEKNHPQTAPNIADFIKIYLGFARIHITNPKEHDMAMAYVSQLPHVLSVLLMNVQPQNAATFAGTSLKEMTRIAEINTKLWADLFLENRSSLINIIEQYENGLSSLKKTLVESDRPSLENILNTSTQKKSHFFSKKA